MIARSIVLVSLLSVLALPVQAQLSSQDLGSAGIDDHRGFLLPDVKLDSRGDGPMLLRQAIGSRPSLLVFVDYTCQTMCGITLGALAQALESTSLQIQRDYRVLIVGLDSNDGRREVETFRLARLPQNPLISSFEFLRGSPQAIDGLMRGAGYKIAYDRARDQYAHAAAVIVVTPQAGVSRALDVLALTPRDVGLALIEAGEGRTGSLEHRIALLCYGWDAEKGIYTLQIRRLVTASGLATVLVLVVALAVLHRRPRHG